MKQRHLEVERHDDMIQIHKHEYKAPSLRYPVVKIESGFEADRCWAQVLLVLSHLPPSDRCR